MIQFMRRSLMVTILAAAMAIPAIAAVPIPAVAQGPGLETRWDITAWWETDRGGAVWVLQFKSKNNSKLDFETRLAFGSDTSKQKLSWIAYDLLDSLEKKHATAQTIGLEKEPFTVIPVKQPIVNGPPPMPGNPGGQP